MKPIFSFRIQLYFLQRVVGSYCTNAHRAIFNFIERQKWPLDTLVLHGLYLLIFFYCVYEENVNIRVQPRLLEYSNTIQYCIVQYNTL